VFLSARAPGGSRVSQCEPICAIVLQRARKHPTKSKNRNLGEFKAELKVYFQ